MKRVNCLIVQAEILKEIFDGLIDKSKIKVLYNGIEIKDAEPKRYNGRQRFDVLGHIAYSKGFYHLIKAHKDIFSKYNIFLKFAGSRLQLSPAKARKHEEFLSGKGLSYFRENLEEISEALDEFTINSANYNSEYLASFRSKRKKKYFLNRTFSYCLLSRKDFP